MFRINEDDLVESIYPVENICDHCENICSSGRDRVGYELILSLNPENNLDYVVNCTGFKSRDGEYAVEVEVEKNLSPMDELALYIVAQDMGLI